MGLYSQNIISFFDLQKRRDKIVPITSLTLLDLDSKFES